MWLQDIQHTGKLDIWLWHATAGGGGWHDWLSCYLQLAAIGLSPLTVALPLNPFPPQAAVPIGLSTPCALPLPAWPAVCVCVCGRGVP